MEKVRIVLVEPAGALNIGSIARVMKNMRLSRLVVVNPKCDPTGEEARLMAVKAKDILENMEIVSDMPSALQGCQRAIATTARSRSLPTALESPREALPWLIEDDVESALIFGPEDRGLSNQELNYGQRFVGIASNPDYPSLNLAQAVAVCTYELHQSFLSQKIDNTPTYDRIRGNMGDSADSTAIQNAPLEAVEAYYNDLQSLLLDIGYLYPHTTANRMAKIRRFYNRANLQSEDVSMLRGMLRQIRWAVDKNK